MDLKKFQQSFDGEPKYRLNQAQKSLFQDLIKNWQEAIGLPLALREKINKEFPIGIPAEAFTSKDKNTVKTLITLEDGLKVETVLMRHADKRNTICVSSQIGCPMNCSFCATGKMGFKRNLETWEILEQILFFARYLKLTSSEDVNITNVVFMGMGEPFLNYENVMDAIKILNDKNGFNLGARHISISTCGVTEGIEKLADENIQINLAISLHAPDNKTRSKIMPANKNYPIEKILKAVDEYIKKTNRQVMFEYIMLKNVNDSEEHARSLAKLLKKPLYMVNLIAYNPTGIYDPSPASQIKKFKEILEHEGITVTQRHEFGQDIGGACGQLATSPR
ncbi:MAG: 23S rRNA (adenine(2503)-C(2))-methyltransferase RlmN [bacterium]|nr:23S rRNA (adenine(2503)-C(2))-methyltransferase RlmN [bacterium]